MARITDAQVKELRRQLQGSSSLQRAALKTGMDRKSAAKYREGKMPRERRAARGWRTRLDPLAAVWPEVQAELERAPGLQALTLLTWLQERYPGQYGNELLRTLQRRVRQWIAIAHIALGKAHRIEAGDYGECTEGDDEASDEAVAMVSWADDLRSIAATILSKFKPGDGQI